MDNFSKLSTDESIIKTVQSLKQNNIKTFVAENGNQAKEIFFGILPKGAEVMNMTSVTLDTLGISQQINESGNYDSIRQKLSSMNRENKNLEMQRLGAAPDWACGSIHAITEDGHILIASNTGSQLAAYVYGANHVIWVVGTNKIVKNTDEGIRRIYEHSLPLEDARARKVYGVGSAVNKLLIINKEVKPDRITLILVKEVLGF